MASTTISIDINTPAGISIAQLTDTLATYWQYQATIADPANPGSTIPNPQTKNQFLKAKVATYLKESYVAARANIGAETGRQSEIAVANTVTVS